MIDAETIFRKGCKCEAAQNRGVKQVEIYPREGTETSFADFLPMDTLS